MTSTEISQLVLNALDSERKYQIDTAQKWHRTDARTVAEELLVAETYLRKARTAWVMNPGDGACLEVLRKVAGTLVRCFQHNGVPMRAAPTRPAAWE